MASVSGSGIFDSSSLRRPYFICAPNFPAITIRCRAPAGPGCDHVQSLRNLPP